MPKWEGTHLSPTSVIKPLAPDVSQGLPSLSPGQQLHPWGRLVHGAVFPPPFCLGFSCILKPTGGDAETSPSPERPLSGPEHSQVDGWFCLSKASLSRALGWLITQHSQPRLPRGPLPAHTPCAVGLVGQLVPVCEGPECHTLQEPFRKRAGGWLVWLGGDPENSEQAGSQLLLGKECTDCGPPVSVRAPGGGLPG